MANPLAKVIRYIVTGGTITAGDVQAAIEQLETITTGISVLLLAHKTRHENGGLDEISVAGLSGVLADQQVPSSHAIRHQNGGDDEISVAGLSGVLDDEQDAGWLKGAVIDVTGLTTNWTVQFNGTKWIVTNNLVGVLPGNHASTHPLGGTDPILGEMTDYQRAYKIYEAIINVSGLADKWILKYDSGSSQWVAQTFLHAASHEQGQPDAISSLPTPDQKLALLGSDGTPGNTNRYLTQLEKTSNIDPYLPTINEKAAMSVANFPGLSNPFATMNDIISGDTINNISSFRSFVYDPSVDKRGTPLIYDPVRNILSASTETGTVTQKPVALIDIYCARILGYDPGSTTFDVSGTITVTDDIITGSISSIVADVGGFGEIHLAAAVPSGVQNDERILVSGSIDNSGTFYVKSVLGNVITVNRPFVSDEIGVGLYTIDKFGIGDTIVFSGTSSNNEAFIITDKIGPILTVYPLPVNETSSCLVDRYSSDGKVVFFGEMELNAYTPYNFNPAPVTTEVYEYDSSTDHYGLFSSGKWIIGELTSALSFFVDIRENPLFTNPIPRRRTYIASTLSFAATGDIASFTGLPSQYLIERISVFDSAGPVTTAEIAVNTLPANAGTNIVVAVALPTTTVNTPAAYPADLTVTIRQNTTQLYVRCPTSQATITASVLLEITDLT
jgi:hypothetical protein